MQKQKLSLENAETVTTEFSGCKNDTNTQNSWDCVLPRLLDLPGAVDRLTQTLLMKADLKIGVKS